MAYSSKHNSIPVSQVITAREYDKNYSTYTSIINGGLDRDNLPVNSITFDDFEDKSVGRWLLVNNINARDDKGCALSSESKYTGGTVNPRGNSINGCKYEESQIEGGGV